MSIKKIEGKYASYLEPKPTSGAPVTDPEMTKAAKKRARVKDVRLKIIDEDSTMEQTNIGESSHATVLLQKAGVTKRIRANPNSIRKYIAAGWTVISESTEEINMSEARQNKVVESIMSKYRKEDSVSLEEKKKSKPDFLDLDKDGNKKESMKKADKDCKMEEVDQIDELSKETLKNYVKAAAGATGTGERTRNIKDLAAATGRHSERAQNDTKKGDWLSARENNKKAEKTFNKSLNRSAGIAKAVDKLTKEEVNQIDELSKETLTSYRGSAKINRRGNDAVIGSQMASNSQVARAEKNNKKRTAGIDLAAKKLAKESREEHDLMVKEAFLQKVVDILGEEALNFTADELRAILEQEQAKRGRGRPKKAVDPNAAPKKTWTPGGRGRPPKNKDTASKVSTSDTKAAAPAAKEPEKSDAGDTQHILVQLRKAATNEPGESGSGKNTIKYLNNTTGQVTAAQARQALTKHDQLKTSGERFKAQRRMGGSHDGMTGFLSGKSDTTTAKPKVSLAQPGWNKKDGNKG